MTERSSLPWPSSPPPVDVFADIDDDQFYVFVPAIMSIGVLFSITTLFRDAVRWLRHRRSERAVQVAANASAAQLLGTIHPDAELLGLPTRRGFRTVATASAAVAVVVSLAATSTYLSNDHVLRSMGSVLALAALIGLGFGIVAAASWRVVVNWPHPPSWTLATLSRLHRIGVDAPGPTRRLTAAVVAASAVTALVVVFVGFAEGVANDIDRPIFDRIVDVDVAESIETADIFGSTVVSIGLVVLVGMSGFRCRVMALVYPATFLGVWLATDVLRELIDRTRPLGGGEIESFPSGHLVQSVFIAGMVSTAVGVLSRSSGRVPGALRVVLGLFVALTAFHRIHREDHWPLDVAAGMLLGLVAVLISHWLLEHRGWHHGCGSCPWSEHPAPTPWGRGVFDIAPATGRRLSIVGAIGAGAAGVALLVATQVIGLPTTPEGDGLGDAIADPVQMLLAALMVAAAALAIRWKGLAAFVMALCAFGIGLLASVQYHPVFTFVLAAMLLVPAVLTWLAWQPHETIGSIALLAVVTVGGLTATAFGSNEIYGHYFGPSHPPSTAESLDSDAEWLWLGEVGPTTATIVAGGLDGGTDARLVYWSAGAATEVPAIVSADGLARFELSGLDESTRYSYAVLGPDTVVPADAGPDGAGPDDADSSFRTFPDGAADLTIVMGSCARNESNGLVFDRMVEHDPDLYLALGDLHYANLESADPGDHLRQYGRSLSEPGQAALFSSVPTAYVWDDHDYGPNDADATSPARAAVSAAYRAAVPNYGVSPDIDQSIAQAFTIGRVRVVMTDTRSMRSGDTMLGEAQLDWLLEELSTASRTHGLVVWANPTPWISSTGPGADDWSAFPDERRLIADLIASEAIDNLIMVSGDAHMVAIDDGSNSGFATDGSPGFPVLHAAALDRPGNLKGGPYSHGSHAGGGQYGLLEISDDGGSTIGVTLSGRNWEGSELLRHEFTIAAPQRP